MIGRFDFLAGPFHRFFSNNNSLSDLSKNRRIEKGFLMGTVLVTAAVGSYWLYRKYRPCSPLQGTVPVNQSARKSFSEKLEALWRESAADRDKDPTPFPLEFEELIKNGDAFLKSDELERAENVYAQALALMAVSSRRIGEAICLKRLADIYIKKSTQTSLIQAAGMYHYISLCMEDPENKQLVQQVLAEIEIEFLSICTNKKGSSHKISESLHQNRIELENFRNSLHQKINTLAEPYAPEAVFQLHREIADQNKDFVRRLLSQCIEVLGKPPCSFAVIGFGSLAREETTPYSDLEFGFLIETDTVENKQYFRNLAYCLHLKVVNLGETILPALNIPCLQKIHFYDGLIPRGFAFDGAGVKGKGCKTPLGNGTTFELIQTPAGLASYQGKDQRERWWLKTEPHLPMELLNFTPIFESNQEINLTKQYQQQLEIQLKQNVNPNLTLREYLARHHLSQEDDEHFDPSLNRIDQEGQLFRAKFDLYRLPHLLIDRLSLLSHIPSCNTFERIEKLPFTPEAKEHLKWLMAEVMVQRLRVYSHYRAQKEAINPLLKVFGFIQEGQISPQFTWDAIELEKIQRIYQILIPFHSLTRNFLQEQGSDLWEDPLYDGSFLTLGKVARRLLLYEEAIKYYKLAEKQEPDNPVVLTNLGQLFLKLGSVKQELQHLKQTSVRYLERAFEVCERIYGSESTNTGSCLGNLGLAWVELGKPEKALQYYERAIAIHEKARGKDSPIVASLIDSMGMPWINLGKFKQAIDCYERAILLNERLYGRSDPKISSSLSGLGLAWRMLGNPKKAIVFYEEALDINQKIYSEVHPTVAHNFNNLASAWQDLTNYPKAIALYEKGLKIVETIYGKEEATVSSFLSNLGSVYTDLGQNETALAYYERALRINEKEYVRPHPKIATCLNFIGLTYQALGKIDKAIIYHTQALEMSEQCHEKEHPDIADYLSNLGMAYKEASNLPYAKKQVERALEIGEKVYGKEHPRVATYLTNLASIYKSSGNLQKVIEYQEAALAVNEKIYDKEHPAVAANLNGLGDAWLKLGEPKKALSYFERSLAILQKTYDLEHPRIATTLNNIGAAWLNLNDPEKAISYFEQALAIEKKVYNNQAHPSIANHLNNLATAWLKLGDTKQAIKFYEQTVAMDREIYSKPNLVMANHLKNLAAALNRAGEANQANEYSEQAQQIVISCLGKDHTHTSVQIS